MRTVAESADPPAEGSLVDRMIGSYDPRSPAAGTDPLYDALASKHLDD